MDLRTSIERVAAHVRGTLGGTTATTETLVRAVRGNGRSEYLTHDVSDPELREAYLNVLGARDVAINDNLERLAASESGALLPDPPAMDLRSAIELVTADTREGYQTS